MPSRGFRLDLSQKAQQGLRLHYRKQNTPFVEISNAYVTTCARLAQGAAEHCQYTLLHILPLGDAFLSRNLYLSICGR